MKHSKTAKQKAFIFESLGWYFRITSWVWTINAFSLVFVPTIVLLYMYLVFFYYSLKFAQIVILSCVKPWSFSILVETTLLHNYNSCVTDRRTMDMYPLIEMQERIYKVNFLSAKECCEYYQWFEHVNLFFSSLHLFLHWFARPFLEWPYTISMIRRWTWKKPFWLYRFDELLKKILTMSLDHFTKGTRDFFALKNKIW